jgi:hypothetical protein
MTSPITNFRNYRAVLVFSWVWLEARGRSGGILLGVKGDILEMESHVCGEFSITATFRNRTSNFRWKVAMVYVPAHHDLSTDFLEELNNICNSCELPLILGTSALLEVRKRKILIITTIT